MKIEAKTRLAADIRGAVFLASDGRKIILASKVYTPKGHSTIVPLVGQGYSTFRVGHYALIVGRQGMLAAKLYTDEDCAESLEPSMENCNVPESPHYKSHKADRERLINTALAAVKKFGHVYEAGIKADASAELQTLK